MARGVNRRALIRYGALGGAAALAVPAAARAAVPALRRRSRSRRSSSKRRRSPTCRNAWPRRRLGAQPGGEVHRAHRGAWTGAARCCARSWRSTPTPSRSPRASTRSAGPGKARGPLHGIPVLLKDNVGDRRPDADDGGLARARRRDAAGRRAHRQAPARSGRRDPGQDEPVGVGELPLDALLERLERARRAVPQSVRARSQPLGLELRLGGRGGGQPLRDHRRDRDRRLDRVAREQLRPRRLQAHPRPRQPRRASSRSPTARTRPDR